MSDWKIFYRDDRSRDVQSTHQRESQSPPSRTGRKGERAMIRSWILLSAIFATFGVALTGCAATPFSPGYYAGGYPYGIRGYYCGEWRVWPGASCVDPRVAY
jgi:hypothetical protein